MTDKVDKHGKPSLTVGDVEKACERLTSSVEEPPEEKYLLRLSVLADWKFAYKYFKRRQLDKDEIKAWKCLLSIHIFCRGNYACLQETAIQGDFFNALASLWSRTKTSYSKKGFGRSIALYAVYLLRKAKLHFKFPELTGKFALDVLQKKANSLDERERFDRFCALAAELVQVIADVIELSMVVLAYKRGNILDNLRICGLVLLRNEIVNQWLVLAHMLRQLKASTVSAHRNRFVATCQSLETHYDDMRTVWDNTFKLDYLSSTATSTDSPFPDAFPVEFCTDVAVPDKPPKTADARKSLVDAIRPIDDDTTAAQQAESVFAEQPRALDTTANGSGSGGNGGATPSSGSVSPRPGAQVPVLSQSQLSPHPSGPARMLSFDELRQLPMQQPQQPQPAQQSMMMSSQQPMMMSSQQPMMSSQQPMMMSQQQPGMMSMQPQQPMMMMNSATGQPMMVMSMPGQQQPMMMSQQPMMMPAQQQQQPMMMSQQQPMQMMMPAQQQQSPPMVLSMQPGVVAQQQQSTVAADGTVHQTTTTTNADGTTSFNSSTSTPQQQ